MVRTIDNADRKLKDAALYIMQNVEEIESLGMKKLSKLLYFADFKHYKKNIEPLTHQKYVRMEHGPVPIAIYDAVEELEAEGKISTDNKDIESGIKQKRFFIQEDDLDLNLDEEERETLEGIVSNLGSYSGGTLERFSHQDTPWQVTDSDDEISYKLVFYRDEELEQKVE